MFSMKFQLIRFPGLKSGISHHCAMRLSRMENTENLESECACVTGALEYMYMLFKYNSALFLSVKHICFVLQVTASKVVKFQKFFLLLYFLAILLRNPLSQDFQPESFNFSKIFSFQTNSNSHNFPQVFSPQLTYNILF